MVTLESTQIRVLVDSVQDRDRDEPHNEQHIGEERTPLLGTTRTRMGMGLKPRNCCVKSKAALLVMFWNTLVTITIGYVLEYGSVLATVLNYFYTPNDQLQTYAPAFFGFCALLYLFYPLAGCLADIKCGKYSIITNSLWFTIWGGVFTCTGTIIIACYGYKIISLQTVSVALILAIGFGLPTLFGIIVLFSSYISFSANVIQFGMDQLHDSPSEDSVLFINWFVFTSHLGAAINKFAVICNIYVSSSYITTRYYNYAPEFIAGLHVIPIVALVLLGISTWIAKRNRQWFLIDTGSRNPYKLVYKVIKFAAQHKSPIRRSAFTYCEDELPSRMDLAKEKYGGPFTTEQVEDVKAFLGILCILLILGSVFMTDIAANSVLSKFAVHLHLNRMDGYKIFTTWYIRLLFKDFLIGWLPEIIAVILIPLYLCVLRSFICRYIPGMLKRIGLAMTVRLLSLLSIFLIDIIEHIYNNNYNKCFIHQLGFELTTLSSSIWYVAIPYILNAISDLLFYIAAYEFICAQSPHAMKGLLIGTFFTIKGVFQLIGVTIILVPFTTWKFDTSFPSCGFVYYLINIVVAVIGLAAYTWVARSYQYRQRDEPDNIYRYAEEYYDRDRDQDQLESTYDYSNDHDDLNVHIVS